MASGGKGAGPAPDMNVTSDSFEFPDSNLTFVPDRNMTFPDGNMTFPDGPPSFMNVTNLPPFATNLGTRPPEPPSAGSKESISDSLYNISSISMLSFTALITIPLIIYCAVDLYCKRREQYMVKRRLPAVVAAFIIIATHGLFKVPIMALKTMKFYSFSSLATPTMQAILEVSDLLFQWALIFTLNLRAWLLHFDHHYETVLASKPWAPLLAPKNMETTFYIKYHRNLGNAGFLLKFVIIPLVVIRIGARVIVEYYVYDDPDDYPNSIMTWSFMALLLVSAVFIGILWSKYPSFDDVFFIKNEFRIVFITVGLLCLGITIINLLSEMNSVNINAKYFQLFMPLGFQTIYCFILWMMIVYPRRKMRNALIETMEERKRMTVGTLHEIDLTSQHWEREIGSKQGYEKFAAFLSNEFAVENLLFVTEYVQLKDFIQSNPEALELLDDQNDLVFHIELPKDLKVKLIDEVFVEQYIVYDADYSRICFLSAMVSKFQQRLKDPEINSKTDRKLLLLETMRDFYVKYVEPNKAPLEINIASRKRRYLQKTFEKDNKVLMEEMHIIQRIMTQLDTSADEVEQLIHDAAIRYRTSRRRNTESLCLPAMTAISSSQTPAGYPNLQLAVVSPSSSRGYASGESVDGNGFYVQ